MSNRYLSSELDSPFSNLAVPTVRDEEAAPCQPSSRGLTALGREHGQGRWQTCRWCGISVRETLSPVFSPEYFAVRIPSRRNAATWTLAGWSGTLASHHPHERARRMSRVGPEGRRKSAR